jgi:hypothetical protein
MAEARNDDAGTVKLARGGDEAGASHLHAETSQFHVHE